MLKNSSLYILKKKTMNIKVTSAEKMMFAPFILNALHAEKQKQTGSIIPESKLTMKQPISILSGTKSYLAGLVQDDEDKIFDFLTAKIFSSEIVKKMWIYHYYFNIRISTNIGVHELYLCDSYYWRNNYILLGLIVYIRGILRNKEVDQINIDIIPIDLPTIDDPYPRGKKPIFVKNLSKDIGKPMELDEELKQILIDENDRMLEVIKNIRNRNSIRGNVAEPKRAKPKK